MKLWDTITGWFYGRPTDKVTIANFEVVNPAMAVYRGGQPISDSEWQGLADLGIQHIIKLNGDTEGSDADAAKFGMGVYPFYISLADQPVGEPSLQTVRDAVEMMRKGNCFVHCEHGQDRTGLVVACYRVWVQGHSKRAAQEEMMQAGFHPLLAGLANFWRDNVSESS
jgi:protein tyrosine/serine phosphatase